MRGASKHINTRALAHNLATLSAMAPKAQAIAVVKANAYGHEATQVVDALARADLLAVAAIGEALALRRAGASQPIVLLEGVFEASELALAADNGFEPVIATPQQVDWLLASQQRFPRLWFKLDTGMGRLGFQGENAHAAMQQLLTRYPCEHIVLMTHFSDADSPERSITEGQIARFDEFAAHYPDCQHCLCNSAGIVRFPEAHRDYIRPGISLYGISPMPGQCGQDYDLQPVMTLKTRVMSIKSFQAGEPIGYGQTYRLPQAGRIAICEIGYADGYLRFIPSGAPILIAGREYTVVGRVSMDMISVAVDERVEVGDEVICWGEGLAVERLAEAAQTIPHQLLTAVTERPRKVVS